ncbi:MAG: T9SS type A sorting domain-containing protein [Bacteroidetes bacterium]|nr:T9SS type A sorting domain-containing protein [Bacteroidota bacterium]
MKYLCLAIIILGTLAANNILQAQSTERLDTEGTDFWFTFPPNAHNDDLPTSRDSVHIYITSKTPTKGKIYYNEVRSTGITPKEIDFEIKQPNEVYHLSLSYFYVALRGEYYNGGQYGSSLSFYNPTFENETVSVKSFHITTEEKSVVYALDYAITSSDAFIVLPTPSLGKEYFIMSYYSSNQITAAYPSQFAIVGVKDSTMVTIVPTVNTYKNKTRDTQNIILNQGEVYLVQANVTSAQEDLTGTHILADKEVAVIAGHQRTAIPPNGSSRDCLLAQMIPVSTWGKNAIITPFAVGVQNTYNDIFRVLAARDSTEIYIDGEYVITLNKGKYYEYRLEKASVVSSNNPIMVATYMKTSQSNGVGDPAMIVVPSVEQYKNSYTLINAPFVSSDASIFTRQYITIIAPFEAIEAGLYLDGNLLDLNVFQNQEIGNTGYYYINYRSTDGTHNLNSIYPFCVIAYGYGQAVSYGYLGGMSMQELDDISLVVVADGCCQNFFQVTYTESFHSGITSVEVIDTTNCSIELKRQTKWKIIWDLKKIDKTKDAVISIKITDIYDNVTIYTDTIKTKYFLVNNCFDSEKIDFGKVTISKLDSFAINIINKEPNAQILTYNEFAMSNNINFTVSKSAFPITINPKDTAKINVFYAPTQVNKKTTYDIDTLIIYTDCFAYIFYLEGEPIADTLRMSGVCNIPLVMVADSADISFTPPTITPNPANSSTINYKFPVYSDSDVSITIYDIEGRKTNIFTGFLSASMYEILIDISDLISNIYFIQLETDTYNHSNKLLIER